MSNIMHNDELHIHSFEAGYLLLVIGFSAMMKEWPETFTSHDGRTFKFEGQWYTPSGEYAGCARYREIEA